MNYIYLVRRTDEIGYNEYDSDVVIAENETEAREISVLSNYQDLEIVLIGVTARSPQIVLASFNAG